MRGDTNISKILYRVAFVFIVVSGFISGPIISLNRIDLRIFDFAILVASPVLIWYVLDESEIRIPSLSGLVLPSALYLALVVVLPFFGLMVFDYPSFYVFGDVRWLQSLILMGLILGPYTIYRRLSLYDDLTIAVKIIIAAHMYVFLLQLLHSHSVIDTAGLLELFYHNRSPYGEYGYHIARYSAAGVGPARLSIVSTLGISIFLHNLISRGSGILYLSFSIVLLIASGSRTGIVGGLAIIPLILLVNRDYIVRNLNTSRIVSMLGIGTTSLVAVFALNVGRIRSSDRYQVFIDLLTGSTTWAEVSGRSEGWDAAIDASTAYTQIGTLSNPAWVLKDLTVIDSYYVLSYVQGGVLLLGSYLLLTASLAVFTMKASFHHRDIVAVNCGLVSIMAIYPLTQNFATGISGKLIICISISTILYCWMHFSTSSDLNPEYP